MQRNKMLITGEIGEAYITIVSVAEKVIHSGNPKCLVDIFLSSIQALKTMAEREQILQPGVQVAGVRCLRVRGNAVCKTGNNKNTSGSLGLVQKSLSPKPIKTFTT